MKAAWIRPRIVRAFASVTLLSVSVTLSYRVSASDSPPIKLAIYSSGEASERFSDLLLTELTGLPNVTMLERGALSKIIQEQALATSSSQGLVKAGSMLGADGIVVLDGRALANKTWVALRLIGVQHGVALGWWEYTVSKEETVSWPKGAALQIQQLIPKLTSAVAKAPTISVVGFTSPSSSRSVTSFERELNSLLLKRLGAEPDLLVLERQKLLDAAFEKILSGDDRKFWSGAYLLEGTINPERIEANSVTVRARLTPPSASPIEFTTTAARTNLAELGSRFVGEVRRALNAKPSSVTWDAEAEARRFCDQAEAAVRWKLWPEAAAAADSALALGKNDLETKRLRLQAYTGLFRIDRRETIAREYKPVFGVLEHYTAAPTPGALKAALDTAYQLQELAKLATQLTAEPTRTIVSDTLEVLGRLTFKYYMGAELRIGNEDKLTELRVAMREAMDSLLKTPETVTAFAPLLLKYGPLWCETPEDGINLRQRIPAPPPFPAFQIDARPFRPGSDPEDPDWTTPLCGWKWSDRSRADEVWQAFLRVPPPAPRPTLMQPQTLGRLPPHQLLDLLSQCVSNRQLPKLDLIDQVPSLSEPLDRKQALELLLKLRSLAGMDTDPRVRLQLFRQVNFLGASVGPRQTAPSDSFSGMKQPLSLKTVSLTNISGFGGAELRQDLRPALTASVLALTNGSSRKPYRLAWAEDKVWVYFEASGWKHWTGQAGGGSSLVSEFLVAAFDARHCLETNRIPEKFLSYHERKDQIELAVFPQRLLLFLEDEVLVLNRKEHSFSSVSSPLKSPRVSFSGQRLFLYNDETLLETTDELKQFTVLASVRRRPAVTPLDELSAFGDPGLFQAAGQLLFCLKDGVYAHRDDRWRRVPGFGAPLGTGENETLPVRYWTNEVLIRDQVEVDTNRSSYRTYYYGSQPEAELWWGGIPTRASRFQPSYRIIPDASQPPARYPLLPGSAPFYYLSGRIAGVYRQAVFPFFGHLLTLSMPQDPKAPIVLQFWVTNSSQPITVNLSLPGREAYPLFSPKLLLGGNAFFLWGHDAPKIWYVDANSLFSTVGATLSLRQKTAVDSARKLAPILAPFDKNQNGKLDRGEYSALAEEPALFELVWSELDSNQDNLIQGIELRFFDFNKDGKLDKLEHRAFLNAVAYYAGSLFLFLDKNGDGLLEESETRDYCGAFLISVAGIFQKYDQQQSGKLDLQQWTALVADLLDRRLTSFFEGLPPLPPAGRREFLEPEVIDRYWTAPSQL